MGRPNLHQGAIGVGVNLETGYTQGGVSGASLINIHPDTENPVAGTKIPSLGTDAGNRRKSLRDLFSRIFRR